MSSQEILLLVLLGSLLGAIGQGARAVVGIKKTFDESTASKVSFTSLFSVGEFALSLGIGAVAGGLASLAYLGSKDPITKEAVFVLLGAGYAGADFIEGFMRNSAAAGGKTPTATASGSNPVPLVAVVP